MGLPKITFNIAENGLNLVGDGIQKTPGLVITGAGVAGKIVIGESKQIFSLKGAEDLGITPDDNPFAYTHISEFYEEAGQGAELWFMLVSDATTYEQMADFNEAIAKKLLEEAKGGIRILALLKEASGAENIVEGLDEDVKVGIIAAQALAEAFALKYMPFRVLISGNSFSGEPQDLFDYATADYDRVAMVIGNNDGSAEASLGIALGRLARIPTQRSLARVKDGSVVALRAYFTNGGTTESLTSSWDSIHDKGYIFLRSFPGRAGYYFTDDNTLTNPTNDFSFLSRGLIMDEAVLIANETLTNELSDEVPVSDTGKIHPAIIKAWQGNIENQIEQLMVAEGKLNGVRVFIDDNQNIIGTNKIAVRIDLQPLGYAKYIEVNIGFTTNLEQ